MIETPFTLPCGATLPNRLAKAAMTEGLATMAGVPTPALERLYAKWSEGGAGLLISGNVQVDGDHLERPGNVIVNGTPGSDLLAALSRLARAATSAGNHFWMQIAHAGRQTPAIVNPHPKAPSAVPLALPGKQFGVPVALTEAEVLELIDRFVNAAIVAREAGYTGVQVHAAHGYLLSQFLNPRANRRDDQWGGNLENRARMLMEVVRRTRKAVGANFPLSVKLNSADFQKGGFAFSDSITVAKWLADAGVDLLEISGGSYEQPKMMDAEGLEAVEVQPVAASTAAREAYFVDFAKAMRAEVKIPLMVTGGFRSRAAMEQALASGAADVIGLGRPLCVATDGAAQLLRGATELDRWEARLHLLNGPLAALRRFDMLRAVDGFAVQYWYYAQLYAIGRNGKPDPSLSVFKGWREVEATHRALLAGRQEATA
jgi:2,4-dienoyl-CoA reductase-like NADH-dependent reductase (Old Yellow Enzyme family)